MAKIDLENITPLLERNDVEFAGVFGSHARGTVCDDSDIDILVRFRKPKGLFGIVELELQLSEALRRKVDLVTEGGLCPHIRAAVLNDLQPLYGRR